MEQIPTARAAELAPARRSLLPRLHAWVGRSALLISSAAPAEMRHSIQPTPMPSSDDASLKLPHLHVGCLR